MSRQTSLIRGLLAACAVAGSSVAHGAIEISDPPLPHPFGNHPVGSTYAAQYFSVVNRGTAPVTLNPPHISSEGLATCTALTCPRVDAAAFVIGNSDGCSGRTLQPGEACSTLVGFTPRQGGSVFAEVRFTTTGGEQVRGMLTGSGRDEPADCLYDWAERTYPSVLTGGTPSLLISPFYGRCYQGGMLCVAADIYAVSVAEARVYLYQGGSLTPLDTVSSLARQSGCARPQ